mmetsp:Transcript_13816/g.21924  ORF Transcript_13816/g.21924 Transcript_13816/m.21924 type:complete len:107 (-) Transcript_13816:53-373(-)
MSSTADSKGMQKEDCAYGAWAWRSCRSASVPAQRKWEVSNPHPHLMQLSPRPFCGACSACNLLIKLAEEELCSFMKNISGNHAYIYIYTYVLVAIAMMSCVFLDGK